MLNFSNISPVSYSGKVISVNGSSICAELPFASLGDIVRIDRKPEPLLAEVVSFNCNQTFLSPLGHLEAVHPGAIVKTSQEERTLNIRPELMGCVLNSLGMPISAGFKTDSTTLTNSAVKLPRGSYQYFTVPKPVLERRPVTEVLETGIRSIDTFNTLGKGQRIVILAEPGVGKSSMLLSLAENVKVDLVIVALIGERGREVSEFYEEINASRARERTIVVASTSDEPAPLRRKAADTAIRIAEIAADEGLHVLLAFDSLTRYLRSLRDLGLAAGELPIRRGYPASVFEKIPGLMERAGAFQKGSITGVFTMLSSSEVDEDPLVEEVKGLTDGHLILTRKLAENSHFPAIDIRYSLSRLHRRFWDEETLAAQSHIKARYSELIDSKDLLLVSGNRDEINNSQEELFAINSFLKQDIRQYSSREENVKLLKELKSKIG
ncbi:MAG TPA: hypothetical protein PKA63_01180 [Oligoflexia bacterium]|nr:hypothetical protein [Oligoflexia bacterium]HMP47262.1 hypothetical protein [Oligoflexia bacterium]